MGHPIDNDGLQLLKILFRYQQVIGGNRFAFIVQEVQSYAKRKRYRDAVELCRQGLSQYPENAALRYLIGVMLINLKDFVKAREVSWDLVVQPGVDPQIRLASCITVALANILIVESISDVSPDRLAKLPLSGGLIRQALGCTQEALEVDPSLPDFKATRGAVLIEAEDVKEGLNLLRDAVAKIEGENKAFYMCYIALGEFRSGETAEAHRTLAVARSLDPHCVILEVMAREFAEGRLNVK